MAGYSGTPLARKLGFAAGMEVFLTGASSEYRGLLEPLPDGVRFVSSPTESTALAHIFATRRVDLAAHLARLRERLAASAIVWVSWPKKASRVASELSENVVRELALPLGFVDVKVCAVSEVWSGLKLVVRKELR
jgi:hypothetical protein